MPSAIQKLLEIHIQESNSPIPLERMEPLYLKQRFKIIRSLCVPNDISLEEINELNPDVCKTYFDEYQKLMTLKKSAPLKPQEANPKITATILLLLSSKSGYVNDIVPVSEAYKLQGTQLSLNTQNLVFSQNQSRPPLPLVHGCRLKTDECFTSTRMYSPENTPPEKAQFSRIIVKDGTYQAIQQNLNDEQRNDLAIETAYQLLLNYDSMKGAINISGGEEMVGKLNAAFLYFKNQLGTAFIEKYPGFSITLPNTPLCQASCHS